MFNVDIFTVALAHFTLHYHSSTQKSNRKFPVNSRFHAVLIIDYAPTDARGSQSQALDAHGMKKNGSFKYELTIFLLYILSNSKSITPWTNFFLRIMFKVSIHFNKSPKNQELPIPILTLSMLKLHALFSNNCDFARIDSLISLLVDYRGIFREQCYW